MTLVAPSQERRRGWGFWGRVGLGWTLVGLGLIGLFLPVLQGWLLLLAGLGLLSSSSPRARRWLEALRRRLGLPRQRSAGVEEPRREEER